MISSQSIAWVERFYAWKLLGGDLGDGSAKDVDALLVLEKEWREVNHGTESN